MTNQHKSKILSKLGLGLTALIFLLAGCSGGGSSSGGGTVSGVSTPSKVSVVNTN